MVSSKRVHVEPDQSASAQGSGSGDAGETAGMAGSEIAGSSEGASAGGPSPDVAGDAATGGAISGRGAGEARTNATDSDSGILHGTGEPATVGRVTEITGGVIADDRREASAGLDPDGRPTSSVDEAAV